jgi:hypothetical protein
VPDLSVVIPAWKAEHFLPRCLAALAAQDEGGFETIVVDDGSPDGTAAVARGAGAMVISLPGNRGAAAARNEGARASTGEILLFIDADVVPMPGLVRAVRARFRAGAEAATGWYTAEPADGGDFGAYKALWTRFAWEQTALPRGESSHLQGALAAVSRRRFEEAGGFDERYRGGSVEDYEISSRLRAAGVRIVFDPAMEGAHHFPTLRRGARNAWERAQMWAQLMPKDGFSTGQANPRSAAAAGCAAAGAVLHAAGVLLPPLHLVALPLDAGFLAASAPFLRRALRHRGPRFAAYCALAHWAVLAAAGAGAASAPLAKRSRRP